MKSRIATGAAVLSLAGLAVFGVHSPAIAQQGGGGTGSDNCATNGNGPPGQPGNSPQYPPGRGGPAVSDDSPSRGQQMSASSGCREFAPGQRVAFGVESVYQQLGTVLASVGGEASATFTVPKNLANGQHHVVFRGLGFNGAPNEVRIPFVVSGGPTAGAPGTGAPGQGAPGQGAAPGRGNVSVGGVQLPRTGSDEVVPLTALGVSLLVAGGGIVLVARRRRHEMASPAA